MAEPLQPGERQGRQQRSNVQARSRRIEADVCGDALLREKIRQTLGRVVDDSAPCELVVESHGNKRLNISAYGGDSPDGSADADRNGHRRDPGDERIRLSVRTPPA